jgi:H/ACA ribonucleoprotein complex subunit 4
MAIVELRKDKPSKFGKRPEERTAAELINYGIVIIDKPSGPTSHQVSAYVKSMLHIEKAGHSGTLDPKVTGVLPVAVGRGTRIVSALLPAGKEYITLMHLHKEVPLGELLKAFSKFTGKIKQLPPVKSAVKRQVRERTVYELDLITMEGQDVLFRAKVEAGTYIRKLCHDLGKEIGSGAHMAELRRTRAGPFGESDLHTLQDLADAYHYHKEGSDEQLKKVILPVESAVVHLKKIWVLDSTVNALCHGATLKVPGIAKIDDDISFNEFIAIMTLKEELIGLGNAKMSGQDIKKYSSGIAAKLEHVFMTPDVYPRMT